MARKNLTNKQNSSDEEFTIEEYATYYIKLKREYDELDEELKVINKRLKTLMVEQDKTEVPSPLGTVTYSVQNRKSFDEERAIAILKKSQESNCIKTKEYIDTDILEGELYNNKLSPEVVKELDSCNKVKQVPILKITKGK